MIELLCARRLERMHLAALRIDARHDVLDDAILAGRIHALQHDQHRPVVVGIEPFLQLGEALGVLASIALASSLSRSRPPVSAGSNEARRKPSGLSMRKRLMGWRGLHVHAPGMPEERGDERRHHRIEIGGAAHDPDIRELRLRLARQIGEDARRAGRQRSPARAAASSAQCAAPPAPWSSPAPLRSRPRRARSPRRPRA